MDDSNDQLLIVLHILEGINLNFKNDPIILTATLSGFKLETETINPGYTTDFDSKLIWETDKKSIRRMRTDNMPIKLECYSLIKNVREYVGYILLPIKNIAIHTTLRPNNTIQPRWFKLVGLSSKWKFMKPEFLMFNIITEKLLFYMECEEYNQSAPTNEHTNLEVFIPKQISNNPNDDRKIKNDDFIQIGKNEFDCDRFVVVLTLKTAKYLEMLLSPYDQHNAQFTLKYKLLGNVCNCTLNKKANGNYSIGEKIIINYRSSLQTLQNYFSTEFLILVDLFYSNSPVGHVKLILDNILKTHSLDDFIGKYGENNFTFETSNSCSVVTEKEFPNFINKPQIDYKFSIKYLTVDDIDFAGLLSSEPSEFESYKSDISGCNGAGDYMQYVKTIELPPTESTDNNKLKANNSECILHQPDFLDSKIPADSKSDTVINYKRNGLDDSYRSYSSCLSQITEDDANDSQEINKFLKTCEINDVTYNMGGIVECNPLVARQSNLTYQMSNLNQTNARCNSFISSAQPSKQLDISDSESTVKDALNPQATKYINCNIFLKTAKFHHLLPHGIWQISLHHCEAESYPVVNIELSQSKLKKVDFQNIKMELIFLAPITNFQEIFKNEPCQIVINGPRKFYAETYLKQKQILEFNVEKNSVLSLKNKSDEMIGKIAIGCSFNYNDDGNGINNAFHSGDCSSASNTSLHKNPCQETIHKKCRDQVKDELEIWKRNQMNAFMMQLKQKQSKKLVQMKSKWKRKKIKQSQDITDKLNKYNLLENELNIVSRQLQDCEVQKFEMQKLFTSEFVALSEKSSVIQDDLRQKLKESESRAITLIESEQKLLRMNRRILEQNDVYKKELDELKGNQLKNEDYAILMNNYKLLESKYQNVLQSKNKYKEKWACSVRDLNKLKSLNSADTHPHQTHENHFMENNNNELINIGISNHMQQYKHFNHKNERLNKSEMNFKATSTTTDYYEDGYRDYSSSLCELRKY